MQLTETSGDVATTVFSAVDDDRRYTDAERRRIFSLH
jgi:hypothetical protein